MVTQDPIRVMVVDDSAVARGFLSRIVEQEVDMRLVGAASNGKVALDLLSRVPADVVLLDMEMPEMGGLEALPRIRSRYPNVRVILTSTHLRPGDARSARALSLGAAETVAVCAPGGISARFQAAAHELVTKIRMLGRGSYKIPRPTFDVQPPSTIRVLAFIASTGGPNALAAVLSQIPAGACNLPILIVQHMPGEFTGTLAERLAKASGRPCKEARHGEPILPGVIYVAPGDYHMSVASTPAGEIVLLNQEPPINFCRPSADPFLESVANVYGSEVISVVLTGMGSDGTKGCEELIKRGARVIAQDQATSVVWGMPGSAVRSGFVTDVLPLMEIAPRILSLLGKHP